MLMDAPPESRTVSLKGCTKTWVDIEQRAAQLNLNRSKYIQQLVETDINHHLLDNPRHLNYIQGNEKYRRLLDICIVTFLLLLIMLTLFGWRIVL